MKTKDMCVIALMTALICIAAPLSVPVGPIPISLATLIVYLAGAVLGWKKGLISIALYLLIGAVGVPVFSGYSGGLPKLVGVTGGYLIGYLPCVAATGFGVDRWGRKLWVWPVSMVVCTVMCYAVGTAWFMIQTQTALAGAMASCVIPFLPGDAAKIVVATVLGWELRKKLGYGHQEKA